MLNRIFLRKSKEIIDSVQAAENICLGAETRIAELRNSNKFNLLREELVTLIRDSNVISRELASTYTYNDSKKRELDKVVDEINQCLNEMELLTKENCNAISEGKES